MGSTSFNKWCRLCMSALNDSATTVTLFDQQQHPHIVVEKLKQFVNLNVDPYDQLPQKVCQSCVVNLDFCIQFVDRCRRVANLMQIQGNSSNNGGDLQMDTLQTELNTHYPYLYGESNYPHTNHDRNPQSVPFPQGSFFGPTENQYHVSTENSRSTIEDTYTTQNITVHTNKNKKCIRKILPKQLKDNPSIQNTNHSEKDIAGASGLPNSTSTAVTSSNVKTHIHNGQYMIPVTIMAPCKKCNAMISASNVQDIKNHNCSSKGKKVLCTVDGCNKKFFTQVTLRYHMKHYHKLDQSSSSTQTSEEVAKTDDVTQINTLNTNKTDQKSAESSTTSHKFVCSWPNCSKSYSVETYLIEHRRTHTGDRPFTCSNCSRGFTRIMDLKKHQLLKVCYMNSK